jgi:Protein of unknown function (DUF3551)
MRCLLFASLLAVLGAVGINSAYAGRYCLQGRQWGYPGNCQFSSYNQCMASASGTNASCGINPRYASHRRGH